MRKAGDEDAMRRLSAFHVCGSNCHSGKNTRTESFNLWANQCWDLISKVRMENGSNKEKWKWKTGLFQTFIPRIMKKLYGNSATE